jgi:hypothetical protein
MKKLVLIGLIGLSCSLAQAKDREVMGLIARCDCTESTVDGQREVGKFTSIKSFRTEKGARNSVYSQCLKEASDSMSIAVTNCQYIKIVDEKIGKKINRRVERIKDDEENNLHNDLISTL